jgi:hypothetical protein
MTARLAQEGDLCGRLDRRTVGARRLAEQLGRDAVVVTLAVDSGFKYMTGVPYAKPQDQDDGAARDARDLTVGAWSPGLGQEPRAALSRSRLAVGQGLRAVDLERGAESGSSTQLSFDRVKMWASGATDDGCRVSRPVPAHRRASVLLKTATDSPDGRCAGCCRRRGTSAG